MSVGGGAVLLMRSPAVPLLRNSQLPRWMEKGGQDFECLGSLVCKLETLLLRGIWLTGNGKA